MTSSRTLPTTGSLAAALDALSAPDPKAEPPLGPLRFLPKLLDLSGSVRLAGALESPLVHPKRTVVTSKAILDEVTAGMDELERRMRAVFLGELPVSSHARMRRELRNPGPSMDGSHPGVRAIRAPFTRYVHGNVLDIRKTLSVLRLELAPKLAAIDENGARLEALDATLLDAMGREMDVLIARFLSRLDTYFAEQARDALQDLPVGYEERDLEPWFLPDGWVPRYLRQVGAVIEAYYRHEASLLWALVRAVVQTDAEETKVRRKP